jgi:hypothetical protein
VSGPCLHCIDSEGGLRVNGPCLHCIDSATQAGVHGSAAKGPVRRLRPFAARS